MTDKHGENDDFISLTFFFDLFLHHVRKRYMHGLLFFRLLSLHNTNMVSCRQRIVYYETYVVFF